MPPRSNKPNRSELKLMTEILEERISQADAARKLGVYPSNLRAWLGSLLIAASQHGLVTVRPR